MAEPAAQPEIIQILNEKASGEGLSDREFDFLSGYQANEITKAGGEIDEAQFESIKNNAKLLELVGTRREPDVLDVLQASTAGITDIFDEPVEAIRGAVFGTAEQQEARLPSRQDLATQAGSTEALGTFGEVMSGEMGQNIQEALKAGKVKPNGMPDIDSFVTDVQRRQSESAQERLNLANENPEAFVSGLEAGELARDIGIGTGAAIATRGVMRAIPGVAGSPIAAAGADVISSGLGAATAESFNEEATLEEVENAFLGGAGLDLAFKLVGPVSRATIGREGVKKAISKIRENLLDKAGEFAFRAIQPVKRTMIRGIERGADSRARIGRILMEQNVMPRIPFAFLQKNIPIKLSRAKAAIGQELGQIRSRADEVAASVRERIAKDFNPENLNMKEAAELDANIASLESALMVDMREVARRASQVIDLDPADVTSRDFRAKRILLKQAQAWANDQDPIRSISQAVRAKDAFRLELQEFGALTLGTKTAFKKMEMILADEIDKAVSVANVIDDVLPDNFSKEDIFSAYGEAVSKIVAEMKAIERSGFANIPEARKVEFHKRIFENEVLSTLYRSLSKADDLLFEKQLAGNTNNIISLRDSLAAGAGLTATGSVEGAIGASAITNILRSKGEASTSAALRGLAGVVKGMQISIGGVTPALESLGGMSVLTPAIYVSLTRPDSPLNEHGYMEISHPPYVDEYRQNIETSTKLSSVEKYRIISELNREGKIKIFMKDGAKKGDEAGTAPGLKGFRDRLERFGVKE